ncbi:MAG: DNA primase [Flavobacteriaceae bacterium]|nr:DNA primase [Flavobacteriaceae bacterium]
MRTPFPILITAATISRIFHAANIEEVVGEYVALKKRGGNLLGLCPFHNERTPSFTVTPNKGIYKCFGCGKAGTAVGFLMEHEQMNYPEALKWLAAKYGIEVEEDGELDREQLQADAKERESLLIALDWSAMHFKNILLNEAEGQNIGLSYFEERGFRADTIEKFGLGYCLDSWDAFHQAAFKAGFKPDYLEKGGLVKKRDDGSYFDFFKGRVMFPIHNLSGKVIGFGGRVMQKDAKTAKYMNSPESEVYHKSDTLYGIFQARKAISQLENCYLVEGYTDVITLHQAGIQNVVASSGTSLTEGQIKLLKRFTENVTVLYDGDFAGIKASLRGIDLLLTQGLNVKVVQFPDGEDPDSYCRKLGGDDFGKFLAETTEDFIRFKTGLLLKDTNNDPIKKAEAMRSVAESVALIPDNLKREVYLRECALLFGFGEEVFGKEVTAIRRRNRIDKDGDKRHEPTGRIEATGIPLSIETPGITDEFQERDLIGILLKLGNLPFEETTVMKWVIEDLQASGIVFEVAVYQRIFDEFAKQAEGSETFDDMHFINHPDIEISTRAVNLISEKYTLSPHWEERYEVTIKTTEQALPHDILSAINRLKIRKVNRLMDEVGKSLEGLVDEEEVENKQLIRKHYEFLRKELSSNSGTAIVR